MKRLLTYFLRGLVLIVPLVVTGAIVWWVLTRVDGWLGLPIPGAGFVITVAAITLIGVRRLVVPLGPGRAVDG